MKSLSPFLNISKKYLNSQKIPNYTCLLNFEQMTSVYYRVKDFTSVYFVFLLNFSAILIKILSQGLNMAYCLEKAFVRFKCWLILFTRLSTFMIVKTSNVLEF